MTMYQGIQDGFPHLCSGKTGFGRFWPEKLVLVDLIGKTGFGCFWLEKLVSGQDSSKCPRPRTAENPLNRRFRPVGVRPKKSCA